MGHRGKEPVHHVIFRRSLGLYMACVVGVGLAPLDELLHVVRRDRPHSMAQPFDSRPQQCEEEQASWGDFARQAARRENPGPCRAGAFD
jgi:hypothetical protein